MCGSDGACECGIKMLEEERTIDFFSFLLALLAVFTAGTQSRFVLLISFKMRAAWLVLGVKSLLAPISGRTGENR